MRSGISRDRVRAQLPPSHYHAGEPSGFGFGIVRRGVAHRATFWWLVGGILLGAVIPFTLIVILPTNKQLLSPTLVKQSPQTERLLARWGALHAVRSVLSGLALLLFLFLAIFKKTV